jgi:hypothetical protein
LNWQGVSGQKLRQSGSPNMSDTKGLIKITYPVEPDSWDGASSEGIWVQLLQALSPHRAAAEVGSIPFSTRTLSCGDKISLEYKESERQVVFVAIVERGGHSTIQVLVEKKNPDASEMLRRMHLMGCGWEGGDHGRGKIYAVDVPPEVDFDEIFDMLKKGQDEGHWLFQTGYIGHPEKGEPTSPAM